jgi:hypothetical protein
MTHSKEPPGTDYKPEACDLVIALMSTGLSLTAAAGAMEISRATIDSWMDFHEEFKDAVSRGEAARVLALERRMLASDDGSVTNPCRVALRNVAPEEWREKPNAVADETKNPIRLLAEQISGRAIRPRLPDPKTIEQKPVAQGAIGSEQNPLVDEVDDEKPRIHTISPRIYEDEEGDA